MLAADIVNVVRAGRAAEVREAVAQLLKLSLVFARLMRKNFFQPAYLRSATE